MYNYCSLTAQPSQRSDEWTWSIVPEVKVLYKASRTKNYLRSPVLRPLYNGDADLKGDPWKRAPLPKEALERSSWDSTTYLRRLAYSWSPGSIGDHNLRRIALGSSYKALCIK